MSKRIQVHVPTGVLDLNEQNVIATTTSSRGGIMEREGERVEEKKILSLFALF